MGFMKKIVLMLMMAVAVISAHAQKYALIDMEYILKNVPAYERANEQLNQVSRKWQAEVEALNTEAAYSIPAPVFRHNNFFLNPVF